MLSPSLLGALIPCSVQLLCSFMVIENSKSLKRPRPDWRTPLPLRKCVKRNVPAPVEVDEESKSDNHLIKEKGRRRRWEDMDHEILVSIMKRLGLYMLILSTCLVSKSWLNATLDALFPPNHVFSFTNYPFFHITDDPWRKRLWTLIRLHLNRNLPPQHYYTQLVLINKTLSISSIRFLAQRLPSIKSLTISIDMTKLLKFRDFASCWKGLVEVDCNARCVQVIGWLWNQINTLKLRGDIKVHEAKSIANDFPRLTHLSLYFCEISKEGLSLILQRQKNLTYLDMRHARVDGKWDPKEWDEELVLKASKIPQFLRCEEGTCSSCFPSYLPEFPPRRSWLML